MKDILKEQPTRTKRLLLAQTKEIPSTGSIGRMALKWNFAVLPWDILPFSLKKKKMSITLTKPEGSTVILQIVAVVGNKEGREQEVDYRIDEARLVGDHTSHGYRLEAIHPTGIENLLHFSRYKFQGHTSVSVECWTKCNIKEKSIGRTFTFNRNMKLFPDFCRLRMYLIEADNDNEDREEIKAYSLPWIKGEKHDEESKAEGNMTLDYLLKRKAFMEEEQRIFDETNDLAPEVTKAPESPYLSRSFIAKALQVETTDQMEKLITVVAKEGKTIGKTEQMEGMIKAASIEGKTIAHTKLDDEGKLETEIFKSEDVHVDPYNDEKDEAVFGAEYITNKYPSDPPVDRTDKREPIDTATKDMELGMEMIDGLKKHSPGLDEKHATALLEAMHMVKAIGVRFGDTRPDSLEVEIGTSGEGYTRYEWMSLKKALIDACKDRLTLFPMEENTDRFMDVSLDELGARVFAELEKEKKGYALSYDNVKEILMRRRGIPLDDGAGETNLVHKAQAAFQGETSEIIVSDEETAFDLDDLEQAKKDLDRIEKERIPRAKEFEQFQHDAFNERQKLLKVDELRAVGFRKGELVDIETLKKELAKGWVVNHASADGTVTFVRQEIDEKLWGTAYPKFRQKEEQRKNAEYKATLDGLAKKPKKIPYDELRAVDDIPGANIEVIESEGNLTLDALEKMSEGLKESGFVQPKIDLNAEIVIGDLFKETEGLNEYAVPRIYMTDEEARKRFKNKEGEPLIDEAIAETMEARCEQAREDHEYLVDTYGHPNMDKWNDTHQSDCVKRFHANPTAETEWQYLDSLIEYWFEEGPEDGGPYDWESGLVDDSRVWAIAERHADNIWPWFAASNMKPPPSDSQKINNLKSRVEDGFAGLDEANLKRKEEIEAAAIYMSEGLTDLETMLKSRVAEVRDNFMVVSKRNHTYMLGQIKGSEDNHKKNLGDLGTHMMNHVIRVRAQIAEEQDAKHKRIIDNLKETIHNKFIGTVEHANAIERNLKKELNENYSAVEKRLTELEENLVVRDDDTVELLRRIKQVETRSQESALRTKVEESKDD